MDDKRKAEWLACDAWSLRETVWLLCGSDYGIPDNAPEAKVENSALDALQRAVLTGALRAKDPGDATQADRLYGHNRFFLPADVIAWAGDRFSRFPLSGCKSVKPKQSGLDEANDLRIIGALLALMGGETPAGKKRSVYESEAAIIAGIGAEFPTVRGLGKRKLEERFARAKEVLSTT